MKKKLITLIICGVIGGTSIAGVAMYKMSEGADETQTLVNAPESEEVNAKEEKSEEESDKDAVVNEDNGSENNGQVSPYNPAGSADSNSLNGGQVSSNDSEKSKNDSVSDEEKDDTANGGSNNDLNNGGNQNGGNSDEVIIPPTEETGSFYEQVEQLIFNRVNEERANAGVPALSYNYTMETYARVKSKDMGVRNYFDHVNPDGEMITAQMGRDGVSYSAWGENIAYIGGVSDATALANQFMDNWMNSPGHKANILSTNFTSIGVGVYKSGSRYYATQEFYR